MIQFRRDRQPEVPAACVKVAGAQRFRELLRLCSFGFVSCEARTSGNVGFPLRLARLRSRVDYLCKEIDKPLIQIRRRAVQPPNNNNMLLTI